MSMESNVIIFSVPKIVDGINGILVLLLLYPISS
jgi:hypothetical protein